MGQLNPVFLGPDGTERKGRVDIDGHVQTDVVSSALPEGSSTEEKQESILTELKQKTEPTDIQLGELIPVLRSILMVIANPSYVDKSANQMRAQITGSITTVTTVTGLTNLGSFPADHLQRMDNMTAWATNIRNLIT